MKMRNFLPLSLILLGAVNIYPQKNNYNYIPETGYWEICTSQENSNLTPPFTWQYVQTPVTASILDIFFIDYNRGWASINTMGSIRTTNSGFTWDSSSYNDTNFYGAFKGIYFPDANTGWCVGSNLQIRKTTNGGMNWFKQTPPPGSGQFLNVYFFDVNTGFAIGSIGSPAQPFIAKTTNGGENWNVIPITISSKELNDQYWFNNSTGWIAGYNNLMKTTNGGTNWIAMYSAIPATANGQNQLLSIYFVNSMTGWIGSSNIEKWNIFKTTNGGNNWVFQPNPVSQNYTYAQINDVRFISADTGWAVNGSPAGGAIMFTSNGGTNWIIEDGTPTWFDCLSIYQRQKAWCGASLGRVWYTDLILKTKSISGELPTHYKLYENYPNPFNPKTKIKFSIPNSSDLSNSKITVYDILGSEISTLVNEKLSPGTYEIEWNGSNYPSGTYFYTLTTGRYRNTKAMILLK